VSGETLSLFDGSKRLDSGRTLCLYFVATTWTNADPQVIWYYWGKHVLGDVLGIVLVTPVILAFGRWRGERRLEQREIREKESRAFD